MPLTTLTVIRPEDLGDARRRRRLARPSSAPTTRRLEAEIAAALQLINLAVHAHRAATLDPAIADVAAARARSRVRVGFGTGDELAEGALRARRSSSRSPSAAAAPRSCARRSGSPTVLGGRERVAACELLVIRARADLDAGRRREAALQLGAALEAMLAERAALEAPDQEPDFAALDERRERSQRSPGEPPPARSTPSGPPRSEAALRIAERVLRRKRALG